MQELLVDFITSLHGCGSCWRHNTGRDCKRLETEQ
jgi:hypothetical protein